MPITVKEMRVLEINSCALGVPTRILMENAGSLTAKIIVDKLGRKDKAVIFAGKGGNAGDSFVVARHLAGYGYNVDVLLFYSINDITNKDTLDNLKILCTMDKTVRIFKPRTFALEAVKADVLIDGLLGVGVKPPLREPIKSAIEMFNRSKGFKVAIDVPSGLNPDTGEIVGDCVRANLTVTFHDVKYGLLKAKEYAGEIVVVKIGIPPEAALYVGPGNVIYEVPAKPKDAHKGMGGRVLVIGGSELYSGAPALSALASLKSGADLAFVAAPESVAYVISSYSPNLIVKKLPGVNLNVKALNELKAFINRVDAIVMGPGLGLADETKEAVIELIHEITKANKPMVLDADALKILAEHGRVDLKGSTILTPHIKEALMLLKSHRNVCSLNDRINIATEISKIYNAVVLLKGPVDLIVYNDFLKLNRTGNQGMSVGGTGDTLTGIAATLLARKINPFKAAYIAAFVNGVSGDLAYKELGERLTATDILNNIPIVFKSPLESYIETRNSSIISPK